MATLELIISPSSVQVGDLVTATYVVHGADDEPEQVFSGEVSGSAVVDGVELTVEAPLTITKPAVIHTKVYQAPEFPGLTFVQTADPAVWTAVAALA